MTNTSVTARKRNHRKQDDAATQREAQPQGGESAPAAVDSRHPAKAYVEDVLLGRIPACKWVRLAVERHVRDLADGHTRGLYFDEDAADRSIRWYALLKHSKGEWAKQTIRLEPWQQFAIWCIFGWKRTCDNTRRFRKAYLEVARKNGKSTIAAGLGLLLLVGDHEEGAEVYSAATKKDQAIIVHSEAVRMVKASTSLRARVRVFKNNLSVEATNSKYEPLGADDDTLDGLNVSGAIIDELHAHKNRGVVDVLETATSSRRQPLELYITTAGFDRNSICWELRDYTTKILEGVLDDDTWWGIIYTLDVDEQTGEALDKWDDEATWIKANPNLGISVKVDDLRRKATKAKAVPTALNNFLRKHCNLWTQQQHKWANMAKWRACTSAHLGGDATGLNPLSELEKMLAGRDCIGAFDLSIRRDLCAWARVYPMDGGAFGCLWKFWMPEVGLEEKEREDRAPYSTWVREGYIDLVDGDTMDYDVIREQILADSAECVLREITFDVANAVQLVNDLQKDGFQLVEFRQGMLSMSPPTKQLAELMAAARFFHGGNPVASWMVSNAVAVTDSGGNTKLTKDPKQMKGRVDGIIAAIMALGRWLADPKAGGSVYEKRGMLWV